MAFSSDQSRPFAIAVIGAGITGLSAAWLLSQARHQVTLYEKDARLGGHANSVELPGQSLHVDTGFIVFNEANYPNFTALMAELGVATQEADMSFAASLQGGRIEYASNDLAAFLGGGRNLFSVRFWSMALDIVRFYKSAKADIARGGEGVPDSARATVYRTLELFVEFGILRKLQLESRASVFELISETAHHEHLVCISCGNTIEFVSPEIERLQDEICRELEFEPTSHLLRISGFCKNCRESGAIRK